MGSKYMQDPKFDEKCLLNGSSDYNTMVGHDLSIKEQNITNKKEKRKHLGWPIIPL